MRFSLHMKLFLLISGVVLLPFLTRGQYGNEWIDYSKTYYKFKIGADGVYRISQAQLAAAGLSSATGSSITIYRKGQKVPVYVSNSGVLGAGDFVELYAEKNRGELETALYKVPGNHPTTKYSGITDSAVYFLVSADGIHPRFTNTTFTVPSPAPAPESYFWYEQLSNNGNRPNVFFSGRTYTEGYDMPLASYDRGEGFMVELSNATTKKTTVNMALPQFYTGTSLSSRLQFSYTSTTNSSVGIHFTLNGTALFDTTVGLSGLVKKEFSIPGSSLSATNAVAATITAGRGGFNVVAIEYPRTFNFSGFTSSKTRQRMTASASNQYLVYSNVPGLGSNPLLIDLTNNRRYTGVNISSTTTQFYIQSSAMQRSLFFTGEDEIQGIGALSPVQFTNYTLSANQGNYIIITHKGHITDPSNAIAQYKSYRESAAGGGYNVVVADVNELYDQFGLGAEFHPGGIRNFLKYAKETWPVAPESVFVIGKGITYNAYRNYTANPSAYSYHNIVPTFGHPGSDNLLVDFNGDSHPELPIGRLSVWNTSEVMDYLNKVKAYEAAIAVSGTPDLENTYWKKNAIHIAGGDLALQSTYILPTFNYLANVYTDSFIGGNVTTIKKSSTDIIEPINENIFETIEKGVSRITFYGHAFATGFDYNLNEPDIFNIKPRFPIFYAMGCDVAQIFGNVRSVSEKYINSVDGGSVGFIASNNYGLPSKLDKYIKGIYDQFGRISYERTFGEQFMENINAIPDVDDRMILHKECILLQGDPALKTYTPEKPDFFTDNSLIISSINPLTTENTSTDIIVQVYNLGRTTQDSVNVTLEHKKPNGAVAYLADTIKIGTRYVDTLKFTVPFNSTTDIGLNTITVRVNPEQSTDELSFANNTSVINLIMRENILKPVYPYEFAIVHDEDLTLKASAFDVFQTGQNFILQIDTTEKFNSSFRKEHKVTNSIGGVIKWKPGITLTDSQVYYWRGAVGTDAADSSLVWSNSSFIYLANGSDGWNQSHYYQFKKNEPYKDIVLEDGHREFEYTNVTNTLEVKNRVYSTASPIGSDIQALMNNERIDWIGCNLTSSGSIKFIVLDPLTLKAMPNPGAKYNSMPQCFSGTRNYNQFEFQLGTAAWRKRAADFIDSIPDGSYVIVSNLMMDVAGAFWGGSCVPTWSGDEALHGAGNTLVDKLKSIGFDQIDSFNRKRVFIYFTKKGDPTFPRQQIFSEDDKDLIRLEVDLEAKRIRGNMRSVVVGPSEEWKTLLWRHNSPDGNTINDSVRVEIFGINTAGTETSLYSGIADSLNLSFISADEYPRIHLNWFTEDTVDRTSANLDYWRILYTPVPEAALNPIAFYQRTLTDTMYEGQEGRLAVAIENLTPYPMDSMLVHLGITKADGTSALITTKKFKPLPGNDTLIASFDLNPKAFKGKNMIMIEANPGNDQPEQFHYNNYGYMDLFVQADSINPILDVTFDGVHILDKDIVSAKPLIKVMLKDDNMYSKLNDTSLLKLSLQKPSGSTPEVIPMDGTVARFIPASGSENNEAFIEFKPELLEDGVYKLMVNGKDVANNNSASATALHYEIGFTVENKPSITNLLNYPNPFSTSTAFVFTLTGSEIPNQFKIQILTVTGKIVREITKQELGPLHIGRNITEYKWDGRDQYGQLLGNGVYLYRLVTSLNGSEVEHRENAAIDKYFKQGFGKMYIMR